MSAIQQSVDQFSRLQHAGCLNPKFHSKLAGAHIKLCGSCSKGVCSHLDCLRAHEKTSHRTGVINIPTACSGNRMIEAQALRLTF